MKKTFWTFMVAGLLATQLGAALPFVFWLPNPSRSNVNDPKSRFYQPDYTPAPTAPAASPTPVLTATPSLTPALTPTESPTNSPTPVICALPDAYDVGSDPTVYCDFEADPNLGGGNYYWWVGGPTSITSSWTQSTSHGCYSSGKFTTGPYSGFGHWIGINFASPTRSYPPASTSNFSMWYQIDTTVTTDLQINEGSAGGGDSEDWNKSITLIAGGWQQIVIPLNSFSSGGGNGIFDVQDITQIWLYHQGPYPAHTLYLDDMQFTP